MSCINKNGLGAPSSRYHCMKRRRSLMATASLRMRDHFLLIAWRSMYNATLLGFVPASFFLFHVRPLSCLVFFLPFWPAHIAQHGRRDTELRAASTVGCFKLSSFRLSPSCVRVYVHCFATQTTSVFYSFPPYKAVCKF